MIARGVAVAACLLLAASPSAAQEGDVEAPGLRVLTRAALRLGAEYLASADPRFVWDTHFGGEIDVVDYGAGRIMFLASYQAILGEELRTFDPNQGTYTLALSASARLPRVELAMVFHHVSRHLSDRPKVDPIDWNMLGGRAQATILRGPTRLDLQADLRGVVQRSSVDYRWELDSGARASHRLHGSVRAIGAAGVRVLGVDASRDRRPQTGYRGEAGVRVEGRGAAAELFAAVERRIDPHQLEFATVTWGTVGFRLLTP